MARAWESGHPVLKLTAVCKLGRCAKSTYLELDRYVLGILRKFSCCDLSFLFCRSGDAVLQGVWEAYMWSGTPVRALQQVIGTCISTAAQDAGVLRWLGLQARPLLLLSWCVHFFNIFVSLIHWVLKSWKTAVCPMRVLLNRPFKQLYYENT